MEGQRPLGMTTKGTDLEIILTAQLDPRTFDSSLRTSKGKQQLWLLKIKGPSFFMAAVKSTCSHLKCRWSDFKG